MATLNGYTISTASYPLWETEVSIRDGQPTPEDVVKCFHRAARKSWMPCGELQLSYDQFLIQLALYIDKTCTPLAPGITHSQHWIGMSRPTKIDVKERLILPPHTLPRSRTDYQWGRIVVELHHSHMALDLLRPGFVGQVNERLRLIRSRCALLTFRLVARKAGDLAMFTWSRHVEFLNPSRGDDSDVAEAASG